MARPFLEAKHRWELGDRARAVATLERIVSLQGPALYAPATLLSDRAGRTFENVVVELISSEHRLVVPFGPAFERLWDAFPAQYAISALDERQRAEGDVGPAELSILDAAARDGRLSRDADDYGRVGKVVLRDEDQPALAAIADGARLERLAQGAGDEAWSRWATQHGDLVADLLLYATFHRVPEMDRSMLLDGIERVAEGQPEALVIAAQALASRPAGDDTVTVGMRLESGDPDCRDRFVAALRSGEFAGFADRCLVDWGPWPPSDT